MEPAQENLPRVGRDRQRCAVAVGRVAHQDHGRGVDHLDAVAVGAAAGTI